MNDKSELNNSNLMTNKKISFQRYRNLSTCLPDNLNSRNNIQDSKDVNCYNHAKLHIPCIQMSKSSELISNSKQQNNIDFIKETEMTSVYNKSNEDEDCKCTPLPTNNTINNYENNNNIESTVETCSNNNNIPNTIPIATNTKRNVLRRQHCAFEQPVVSESTTSHIISTNSLKKWKTLQTGHSKDQQATSSSPTPCRQISTDPNTVTNSGQMSRSGFLRYPLRKAMSYVKPYSESITTVKSNSQRLQHTITIEQPDESKIGPNSKYSSRSSLRNSVKRSDLLIKTATLTNVYQQLNNPTNQSSVHEVYTGELCDVARSKQDIKSEVERKVKQKDIRHLNDLITNILPRSLSNAFRRPVGKYKSASPTSSNDHHIEKLIDSFKFDNFEVENQDFEKPDVSTSNDSASDIRDNNIPTRNQLQQWEQSFDMLLADADGLSQFHNFLKSEYSEENIEFWLICELYKHLPQEDLGEESQRIYRLYLAPHSPHEVNLDSETRNQTIANLTNPTNESFILAQQTIQGLMNKDSYQRFLRSSLYFELKQLVWHTYPQRDESDESNVVCDPIVADQQTQYSVLNSSGNKSSLCFDEEQVKEFPTSPPESDSNIISPTEAVFPHETSFETSDIYSLGTIPSPPIDCTMYNLFREHVDNDEESSIQHSTFIQTNDNISIHDKPNSVHIEAAPHSPELCYTSQSLMNTDCCKLKQDINTEL
ncbi:Regulator of G-protein signaling 5 [Schistosoma japonicum]|uniref:Regulator of G-protein signaling 5 n=1 Tax=Schistosoma japonicum TaxID=6182 RepID=A0A4Z2CQ75_SCHJA|nr:Regulator of G-protein signaling 5 [Schistosoma japonicum]